MTAESTLATTRDKVIEAKDLALTLDFVQAVFDDPALLEDVPNGATLMLLPDDDPEYVSSCIERGLEDLARGFDVYFRHYPTKRTLPRDDADPPNGE